MHPNTQGNRHNRCASPKPIAAPEWGRSTGQDRSGREGVWMFPSLPFLGDSGMSLLHTGGLGTLTWLAGGSLWDGGQAPARPAGTAEKQERSYCSRGRVRAWGILPPCFPIWLSLTGAEPRFVPPGMCSIPSVLPVTSLLPSPPHTGTCWAVSPGAARHFLSQLDCL